jgi:biotin transport system substrate-specific component
MPYGGYQPMFLKIRSLPFSLTAVAPTLLRVVCGSLFVAAAAQVSVPFWPVPMTMQPFAIMLIGLLYSPIMAAAMVSTYVMEGLIGLPVFSGLSSGVALLLKPTGGYILGFTPMAVAISFLARSARARHIKLFIAALVGGQVVFLFGLPWLASFVGWEKAFQFGYVPFIVKEVLSAALASISVLVIKRSSLARYL